MNYRCLVLVGGLAACVTTGLALAPAGGQQIVVVESARPRMDSSEMLRRLITVHVRQVSLIQAVHAVAEAANVQVQYHNELLDSVATPVTLQVTRMPLGKVLMQILSGERLRAIPIRRDMISIERVDDVFPQAQESGTITGVVKDGATKQPVAGATVAIDALHRSVRTAENGTFRIANVPAGDYKVVIRRLGYTVQTLPVSVNGHTAPLLVTLQAAANVLNEVVTTATGDQRRIETGNAIGTIKADSVVPTTLIRNMSDLLQARIPGVVVSNTTGQVGAPSKIRIRGVNSLNLNNDPIVIVDGIRLQSEVTSSPTNTGSRTLNAVGALQYNTSNNAAPSRLDDIDPSTIESIDVLRGPSATSLYGSEASNGVIVIKTKRGQAGNFRFDLMGNDGWSYEPGSQPAVWTSYSHLIGGQATPGYCVLAYAPGGGTIGWSESDGTCVIDSVKAYQPSNNPDLTTLGTGYTRSLDANVSGGTDRLRQFLSANAKDDIGLLKMSNAEHRRILREWGTEPPSWMQRPNTESDFGVTERTDLAATPKLDLSLSAQGIYRNVVSGATGIGSTSGAYSGNYYGDFDTLTYLPSEDQRTRSGEVAKHGVASGNANFRPLSWLSGTGTLGSDYTVDNIDVTQRAQDCTPQLNPNGCTASRSTSKGETFVATANGSVTAKFSPLSWLTSQTGIGEQYTDTKYSELYAGNNSGTTLSFGSQLLSPAPIVTTGTSEQELYAITEAQDEKATAGVWLEQQFGIRDRLFLTAGFRQDASSGFGQNVNNRAPTYPKFSASWVISNEPFFPQTSWISSLRLRSAYGKSGEIAGQTLIQNSYYQTTAMSNDGTLAGTTLVPGIQFGGVGNPDLQPERTGEWEGGFDADLFEGQRVHIEATLYNKLSKDAIVPVVLPISAGNQYLQYVNIGSIENRGYELMLTARLLDLRPLSWDVTINSTHNTNKLVSVAPGAYLYCGVYATCKVGYPIDAFFRNRVLSYEDKNHDGILSTSEIVFDPNLSYEGSGTPRYNNTYSTSLGLLNGVVRINASFDHVIGLSTLAQFGMIGKQCQVDATCTLAEQAETMVAAMRGSASTGGAVYQTNTLRFQELSVTYNLSPALAARWARARSASVTFAGRNLHLWTDYLGKDPNIDLSAGSLEFGTDNGTGLAQPRNWTFRVNLGY